MRRSKNKAGLIIGLVMISAASLRADFGTDLAQASKPLDEGLPEIAVTRLRDLLGPVLSDEHWRAAGERLAEALIAVGQPTEALRLLQDSRFDQTAAVIFWRAQALSALDRWEEASELYGQVAADRNSSLWPDAIFGMAETLRALGRTDEALQKLTVLLEEKTWKTRTALRTAELFLDKADATNARRILDKAGPETTAEHKQRRFLRGRLDLLLHRPDRALTHFQSLIKKPKGVSHALLVATLFRLADAHLELKTPETGDDFLEDFIDHHPGDAALPLIFAKLDELYRAERKPARAELERWTREAEQPRRGFAQWYLARIELRAGHRDRALQLLEALEKSDVKNPELAAGLYEYARLEAEDRNFDHALATLEEARAWQPNPELLDRIALLSAETRYNGRQFEAATTAFDHIAHSNSPFAALAMYNSSLGWLQLGDHVRFASAYEESTKHGGGAEVRADLRLEEGLLRAAQGHKDAAEILQKFVAEFPTNARRSEAWVALAEIAFHDNPPRLDEARKYLAQVTASKATPAAAERADYLSIWIEDSIATNGEKMIELANQFLRLHPDSAFVSDVRMKLAEAYYLRQDFANAQTQFELFAQGNPTADFAEKALFFAGESAMASMAPHSLDRAIVLFDQVVQLKRDLRWAARNEQAVIERKLGKPQEALVLYDEVLKGDAKPGEKREAMCGKGDVFFDLSGSDPANYDRAIAAYDQLANDSSEASHWRNQALFKKGICLEKKADRDAALATFYQVVETSARPERLPEFFWFYKAGFNAARLLEIDSRWNSAAKIYEKLVAAGGTRSDEAKARLTRLRLEHFLWEE
ncbi:MAG: hypothetical protein QOH39_551 [Verrucomicrobiota bacterium]